MLYIKLSYPSEDEELDVLRTTTGTIKPEIGRVLSDMEMADLQKLTRQVHIADELLVKINALVRSTRPETTTSDFVKEWCDWGAGPRAGQALVLCAKARAVLHERFSVMPEDIRTLAFPVLRHRIAMNFRAEAEGITSDHAIQELLNGL